MKKTSIVLTLLVFCIRIYSQEVVFDRYITLKSFFKEKRESFPIVNSEKEEVLLFLLDNAEIKAVKFNKDFEMMDTFSMERPIIKFNVPLGHSIDDEGYHLFFSNDKYNEFYTQSIDFNSKNAVDKELLLKLNEERFLETISYNDNFYLITIKKRSSILKIYTFEGNNLLRTDELDFSDHNFSNNGYSRLFDVFGENNGTFKLFMKVHKIDNTNPNPLDLTTKENKIYYYNGHIYITLDNNIENTKIITISLSDYSNKVDFYNQLDISCGESTIIKSNSYLFMDYLYQIKGCKYELSFRVIDLKNNSIVKAYRVKENEEINFRNTPIIQEGGVTIFAQEIEKELEVTKQILKKISTSDIGITARLSNNNIELTMGGYKDFQTGVIGAGGMKIPTSISNIETPYGTLSRPATYHYNPTMYGYSSYTNSRAVYFKSLLETTEFNHVTGEVTDNAYDKIKDYVKDKDEVMLSKTIFKIDNHYVLGYYIKAERKYYLIRFEE
jgi:hypothetical protein